MKKTVIWILAAIVTVTAGIYQRMTGPTYPVPAAVTINGEKFSFSLPRSHGGIHDAEVSIPLPTNVEGDVFFRKFPTNEEWTVRPLIKTEDGLKALLPHQVAAAKLEYYFILRVGEQTIDIGKDNPIVIRFKGDVPAYVLIPHILFMFLAMLFSNVSGIMALVKNRHFKSFALFTFIFVAIGGMILGPIVQYFAFNEWWTGVPFGWDLTDNKTLIAFIAFGIAVLANRKKDNYAIVILAAIIMLLVFSIPHSMFGSEFDYTTGVIKQASVLPAFQPMLNS